VNDNPGSETAAGAGFVSRRIVMVGGIGAAVSCFSGAIAEPLFPSFSSGRHQFTEVTPQNILPSIRMFSLTGGSVNLAEFIGRPLILNFWAAWCAACKTELPILDRISARTGQSGARVIAVSEDRGTRDEVGRFVQSLNIRHLAIYLDPNGYLAHPTPETTGAPFALYGMPITYLIARSGRIVGYTLGAADWTSSEADALIALLHRA
jgi:thiol-disulfide isomerase/thioredoxin